MDEAYIAAMEEDCSNYGATSSVPKVYHQSLCTHVHVYGRC